MNNCSICGWGVAWCVDKDDKGTYWLCGRCAVDYYREKIERERLLVRVAREAKALLDCLHYDEDAETWTFEEKDDNGHKLWAALKELPEGIID